MSALQSKAVFNTVHIDRLSCKDRAASPQRWCAYTKLVTKGPFNSADELSKDYGARCCAFLDKHIHHILPLMPGWVVASDLGAILCQYDLKLALYLSVDAGEYGVRYDVFHSTKDDGEGAMPLLRSSM